MTSYRLCLAIIIALPAATPSEFKNTAHFALGHYYNGREKSPFRELTSDDSPANGWPDGFAFILSFLAPLWTICSFDSSVHISEEASNAAVAVPWAIVSAIGIAGVLGWGALIQQFLRSLLKIVQSAINMALAFCMSTDLESLIESDQPMAAIFLNSFGQKPTLAIWAFIIIVQCDSLFDL